MIYTYACMYVSIYSLSSVCWWCNHFEFSSHITSPALQGVTTDNISRDGYGAGGPHFATQLQVGFLLLRMRTVMQDSPINF